MSNVFTRGDEKLELPDRLATPEKIEELKAAGWSGVGDISINTPRGKMRLSAEEALREVTSGQAVVSPTEGMTEERMRFLEREREGRASKPWSEIQAGGAGVLRGISGTLSDYALAETGLVSKERLADLREFYPGISTATELAGLGLGVFAGAGPVGAAVRAGEAVAARAGGGVIGRAAGAGAEGAIFGGAQAVDNLYLSDKPFAADAVLAEIGSGALFGGALGGAVSLVGAGFGKLASKIDDGALRSANPVLEEGSEAYKRFSREVVSDLDNAKMVRGDLFRKLGPDTPIKSFAPGTGEVIDDTVKGLAASSRIAQQRVEKALLNADDALDIKRISKLSPKQSEAIAKDLTHLDSINATLSEAAGVSYQPTGLAKKLENIAAQEGVSLPMTGGDKSQLFALAENLGVVNTSEWVENVTGSEAAGAFINLWAAGKTMSAMAKGAPGAGDFFRGAAGKAIGNLARKPAGALGQLVGGMGSAYGRAKDGIVSRVGKFVKVAARATGSKAAVPVATTILGKVRFDPNVGEVPDKGSPFKQRAAELDRAVANPTATAERIRQKLAPINHVDPELGALMLQNAMNKLMFYHSKAPRNPLESQGLYRVGRWEPPASELARFARYVRAGEEPLSLLDDMAAGRVTPEAVEAVKVLYPEIYSRVQLELVTQLSEPGAVEALDYGKRVQLKIFFDLPTDPTLTDEFYATMQDLYVMRNEQAQQGSDQYSTPGAVSKAPGLTEQPTAAQRIEM